MGPPGPAAEAAGLPPGMAFFSTNPVPPEGHISTGVRISTGEFPWSPTAGLGTPARYGMGHAVANGRLHVTGGDGGGVAYTLHQAYNPATGAWSSLAPMPAAIALHTLSEVGGMLYAIGGRDFLSSSATTKNTCYRYDPATNTWTTMAPMPVARRAHAAVAYEGRIHVFGGSTSATSSAITGAHHIYDVATNSWSEGPAMPTGRFAFTVSEVHGVFYLVGGETSAGVTREVATYNPATGAWGTAAPMSRFRQVHSAVVANGLIYVMGGTRSTFLNDCEQFDPMGGTWTPILSMTQNRAYSAAGNVGGKIVVVGGQTGTANSNTAEEYLVPRTLFGIEKL